MASAGADETGAADQGGGGKWLDWFGYFSDMGNGWIYQQQHHWMYEAGSAPDSIWLYTPAWAGSGRRKPSIPACTG